MFSQDRSKEVSLVNLPSGLARCSTLVFCALALTACNDSESDFLDARDITTNIKVRTVNNSDVTVDVKMYKANNPLLTINLSGDDKLVASNGAQTIGLQAKRDPLDLVEYEGLLPLQQESEYRVTFSRGDGLEYDSSTKIPTLLNIVSPVANQVFSNPQQEFSLAWEANALEYTHVELSLEGSCQLSNNVRMPVVRNLALTPDVNEYVSPISTLIDFDELVRAGGETDSLEDITVTNCQIVTGLSVIAQNDVNSEFRSGRIRGIRTEQFTLSYVLNEIEAE